MKEYNHILKNLIGVDFTMGNGHDTVFLADYCSYV